MRPSSLCDGNSFFDKTTIGVGSIQRCYLTSIGNPIVEIRQSYDRLISTMGFPTLIRWHIYIEPGPMLSGSGIYQALTSWIGPLVLSCDWPTAVIVQQGHGSNVSIGDKQISLVQDCSISSPLAMEMLQSCTNSLTWSPNVVLMLHVCSWCDCCKLLRCPQDDVKTAIPSKCWLYD